MWKYRAGTLEPLHIGWHGVLAQNHDLLFVRSDRAWINQVRSPGSLISKRHFACSSGIKRTVRAGVFAAQDKSAAEHKSTAQHEAVGEHEAASKYETTAQNETARENVGAIGQDKTIVQHKAASQSCSVGQLVTVGKHQTIGERHAFNPHNAII